MRNASLGVSGLPPFTAGDAIDEEEEDVEDEDRDGVGCGCRCGRLDGHLALELCLLGVCSVQSARLVRGSTCELVIEVLGSKDGHFNKQFARDRVHFPVI